MDPITQLTEIFSHFPGIGPRQAKRFVFYLLGQNDSANKKIADLIVELKKDINSCTRCMRFFSDGQKSSLCNICSDESRDKTKLLIIAKDVDLDNIERSRSYEGLYFVLGGLVPILDKNPEERIRQFELKREVERNTDLKEIIIALSATVEGDHTAEYIRESFKTITEPRGIKVSVLGRGLSTGTELEYSDIDTIKNALKHRE
ncbi:MAG: recombination protein RecR [Parcubacteria group bacterium GW2011_GWF2_38_76]|nr:MAG: recombination protein RecR [Parcubacteria group bacterium GW2011_GWF2_38_76]HBM45925.1 recombination protein RecR [Patescibacteria group bacterium]